MKFLRPTDPPREDLLQLPVLLGSLGLSGFVPYMRGTAGTLAVALPSIGVLWLAETPRHLVCLALFGAFSILSLVTGRVLLARYPGLKDPGWFVLDEAAGYFAVLSIFVPRGLLDICVAFLTFRLYDICKPWPVRSFERLPGSVGILADDLAGAVLAAAVCMGLRTLVPLS